MNRTEHWLCSTCVIAFLLAGCSSKADNAPQPAPQSQMTPSPPPSPQTSNVVVENTPDPEEAQAKRDAAVSASLQGRWRLAPEATNKAAPQMLQFGREGRLTYLGRASLEEPATEEEGSFSFLEDGRIEIDAEYFNGGSQTFRIRVEGDRFTLNDKYTYLRDNSTTPRSEPIASAPSDSLKVTTPPPVNAGPSKTTENSTVSACEGVRYLILGQWTNIGRQQRGPQANFLCFFPDGTFLSGPQQNGEDRVVGRYELTESGLLSLDSPAFPPTTSRYQVEFAREQMLLHPPGGPTTKVKPVAGPDVLRYSTRRGDMTLSEGLTELRAKNRKVPGVLTLGEAIRHQIVEMIVLPEPADAKGRLQVMLKKTVEAHSGPLTLRIQPGSILSYRGKADKQVTRTQAGGKGSLFTTVELTPEWLIVSHLAPKSKSSDANLVVRLPTSEAETCWLTAYSLHARLNASEVAPKMVMLKAPEDLYLPPRLTPFMQQQASSVFRPEIQEALWMVSAAWMERNSRPIARELEAAGSGGVDFKNGMALAQHLLGLDPTSGPATDLVGVWYADPQLKLEQFFSNGRPTTASRRGETLETFLHTRWIFQPNGQLVLTCQAQDSQREGGPLHRTGKWRLSDQKVSITFDPPEGVPHQREFYRQVLGNIGFEMDSLELVLEGKQLKDVSGLHWLRYNFGVPAASP
ncbi:MAG: hypothetical protein U1A77_10395 [Pirellulales bacterium]